MQAPLKGTLTVTNPFGQPGFGYFGKHAGVDLRAAVGTPLYAPDAGKINERYVGSQGIKVLGAVIGGKWHRFLHLNDFSVVDGQTFGKGKLLGHTGNTGGVAAHLHWDVRKAGTAWTHSFSDYYDPMKLLNEEDEMVTLSQLQVLYRFYLGRTVSDYGKATYLGKVTFDAARKKITESETYRALEKAAEQGKLNCKVHLPKDLR